MDPATDDRPALPEIRTELDEALFMLRAAELGAEPRRRAERALGRALEHVYAALADLGDQVSFRTQTQGATEAVRDALGHLMEEPTEDEAASRTTAAVARCLGGLQQLRWVMASGLELPRTAETKPLLLASMFEPQLLDLRRSVLRPAMPLEEREELPEAPEPEVIDASPVGIDALLALASAHQARLEAFDAPEPEALPEEQAPPEPASALGPSVDLDALELRRFGVAIEDAELLEERARDCVEDLGMMGRMRRCADWERWASGAETERRMLTRVDALASLGVGIFPSVVRLLDDRPLPDPELTFGNLFFFLSIAGDDAFDQAVRILRASDLADPAVHELCVDAVWLAPHPRIRAAAGSWLEHASAPWRRLGVEVLARRGELSLVQFDALGRDEDHGVLAALARSMPTLREPAPPGALGWFLQRDSEPVVRAALEASVRLGRGIGLTRATEICQAGDGAYADAVMVLAVAGPAACRALLEEQIATACSPASVRALGWFGDPSFVPFLLGRLRDGEPPIAGVALEALERITGASIVDAAIVPEYLPGNEPFTRQGREYDPPGLLDGNPDAWSAWWRRWGDRADPKVRYRWGRPYRVADSLYELEGEDFLQGDRPWVQMELCARGGWRRGLDYQDLIVRQRAGLGEARARVGGRLDRDGWTSTLEGAS